MINETMKENLEDSLSLDERENKKIREFIHSLPLCSDVMFSYAARYYPKMLKRIAEFAGETDIEIVSSQAQAFMPGTGMKDTTVDAVLETTDNRVYLFQMTERKGSVTRKKAQYDAAKGIVDRVLSGKKYKSVPDVRHITIAPGQHQNTMSCLLISQETLEYSPAERFDGDPPEIRNRYFHKNGSFRKTFLDPDYVGSDKVKEQFVGDLREPDFRKIHDPVLRSTVQSFKGNEEAIQTMCKRERDFLKKMAQERVDRANHWMLSKLI